MNLLETFNFLKKSRSRISETFEKKGFKPSNISSHKLDNLSDSELSELNSILNWNCFTTDSQGRRFGAPHSEKKRAAPQTIPDRRANIMNEVFGLSNRSVLEIGCFEGVHTTSLCMKGAEVKAIDSRLENVVKTIVRTHFYGFKPDVFTCNIENMNEQTIEQLKSDFVHHVGVLYHLKNPVQHLRDLAQIAKTGLLLDTHIAEESKLNGEYSVDGKTYRYFRANEFGHKDVFSGMYDHSKWLLIDDIKNLLIESGFKSAETYELRQKRNGSRAIIIAKK